MTENRPERRFVVEFTESQLDAIYAAFDRHDERCDLVDETPTRARMHRRSLAPLEAALMPHLAAVDDRRLLHASFGPDLFMLTPEEWAGDFLEPEEPEPQWADTDFGWQSRGEFTSRERFTLQALKIPETALDLRFGWSIRTGHLCQRGSHPWARISIDNRYDEVSPPRADHPTDTALTEQAHRLQELLVDAGFTRRPGIGNPFEGAYVATFRDYYEAAAGDGYRTVYLYAYLADPDGGNPFPETPAPVPVVSFATAQRLIRESGGCDIDHPTLTGTPATGDERNGEVTGYDPDLFDYGHGPTGVDDFVRANGAGHPGWDGYVRGWTQFEWEAAAEAVHQTGLDLCSPGTGRLCRCSLVAPSVLAAANGHMRFPETPAPQLFRCWHPIDWFTIADNDPTVQLDQPWDENGPTIAQIRAAWNAARTAGGTPALDVDAYLTEDRTTRLELSWLGVTFPSQEAADAAIEPISSYLGQEPIPTGSAPPRDEPTLEWMWC